eukprot:5244958-Amphidinium_carterae.2
MVAIVAKGHQCPQATNPIRMCIRFVYFQETLACNKGATMWLATMLANLEVYGRCMSETRRHRVMDRGSVQNNGWVR